MKPENDTIQAWIMFYAFYALSIYFYYVKEIISYTDCFGILLQSASSCCRVSQNIFINNISNMYCTPKLKSILSTLRELCQSNFNTR